MRRWASYLFLGPGCFLATVQVFIGLSLLDLEPGVADEVSRLIWFASVALPFLLLGAWLSPGPRWREFGATLLIASVTGAFAFVSVLVDSAAGKPPLGIADFTWATGLVNLLLVGGAGLLLYRSRPVPI